jgi:pimeloyl-ACP methyl ester carboxylesterase
MIMIEAATQDIEHETGKPDLVVIVHGMGGMAERMKHVVKVVTSTWAKLHRPAPLICCPTMGYTMASFDDPCDIAVRLLKIVDDQCAQHPEIDKIILVGYSFGSLIVRKCYVYACGECADDEFEPNAQDLQPRPWVHRVERIVLLAGMNRGWHMSAHLSPIKLLQWGAGVVVGNAMMAFTLGTRVPMIFRVRRGAPFLTMLRLQWMAMRRRSEKEGRRGPLVIQLLGTIDDMVSPEDNIDLVAGHDFYYIDVPKSGHENVIVADDSPEGVRRQRIIARALAASAQQLEKSSILPSDHALPPVDHKVTDVVFVIHGIRDEGYWTQKIARRVVALARERNRRLDKQRVDVNHALRRLVKTETSSYGYFAMLPFLLPNVRRKRVEWLMDRYAENRAMYPNAEFSFVGHSHGTYMLARALESYPCIRFKNVAFAGSVVRRDYNWSAQMSKGRVEKVLNFVASADWVVALFPRTFQMLRWQDLGSAGHDGFTVKAPAHSLREDHFVKGGHGAALKEDYWRVIAHFVLDGAAPQSTGLARGQSSFVLKLGKHAPVITLSMLAIVLAAGMWLLLPVTQSWHDSKGAIYFALYVLIVWKLITWF